MQLLPNVLCEEWKPTGHEILHHEWTSAILLGQTREQPEQHSGGRFYSQLNTISIYVYVMTTFRF